MQCDTCRREAVVYQPYSGKYLCPAHFLSNFEAKAKRTIRSHGWLRPGDHIAAGLSGDAAGAALLLFLAKLIKGRRDIRLSAITVDPGIAGSPLVGLAGQTAAACGVGWFSRSFAERYGTTLDEIAKKNGREAACRSCRVLRNDLIGEIAEVHGVTRCAFAATVDDTAGDFFSDLLSGKVEHTLFPSSVTGRSPVPVIRPFMEIPATEVVRYAELCSGEIGFPRAPPPCPCAGSGSLAADAEEALDAYDHRHPATKFALANLAGTLAGIAASQDIPPFCPVCGEVINGNECGACKIRRSLGREPGS